MNGRVLANASIFALGIIMIIGGGWAIWHGSGYIQLEWGWSSVIAGAIAATGGVLTLGLGFVLQRLDAEAMRQLMARAEAHMEKQLPLTEDARDTLIGMGARILSGAEIGAECLIAAGALVTEGRRVPPRSVVMGVPAKVIRPITAEELERTRTINVHYLEMAQRYVRGAYPPPWHRLEANKGS